METHAHQPHPDDRAGRLVSVLVGVIGIGMSVVTIAGHRAHTEAVLLQTQANDQWGYYQAKKIREHAAETAAAVVAALASDPGKATAAQAQFGQASAKYKQDADGIEGDARSKEADARRAERRALGLDVGEGFMELGLVLSSLYFLGRRRIFPVAGIIAAITGTVLAVAAAFY
jgi:Domain of unknown function (DUF4337)